MWMEFFDGQAIRHPGQGSEASAEPGSIPWPGRCCRMDPGYGSLATRPNRSGMTMALVDRRPDKNLKRMKRT
jgi:hypothetical protein